MKQALERVLPEADSKTEMGFHHPARREGIGFFYSTTTRRCDDCEALKLQGLCPATCEGSRQELKMGMEGWNELCERSN